MSYRIITRPGLLSKGFFIGFWDAISGMTVSDAFGILKGHDTAATDYFRNRTHTALEARFHPIVRQKIDEVGVSRVYGKIADAYNRFPPTRKGPLARPLFSRLGSAVTPLPASAASAAVAAEAAPLAVPILALLLGFADADVASLEVLGIERRDRRLGTLGVHLYEAETPRPAGFPVTDEGDLVDGSVRRESGTNIVGGCREREVTDKQSLTGHGVNSLLSPSTLRSSLDSVGADRAS